MKGGRVEFNMPKARVALQDEPRRVDVHVWWACATLAALLAGIYLGVHIEQRRTVALYRECRPALSDGRPLHSFVLGPAGAERCTYLPPPPSPRKGKLL